MGKTALIDRALEHEVMGWRQAIHAHPEMAFEEIETSTLVITELKKSGYKVKTNIAKTGVVGTIIFGKGPSIALRADMDALPIEEQNDVAYASKTSGCMHACGHDGHTAIMLGVAKSLAGRTDLKGTLHIIFQPAEENEAGARAMIEAGLLEDYEIDAIYALHNMPGLPVGQMKVRPGAMLASFDKFDISITGQGGHGAFPELAQDSILIASQLVMALNMIVSRNIAATEPAVLSVGHFEAMGTYNVIPEFVKIMGSCRSLSPDTRQTLKQSVIKTCAGFAAAHDVKIVCDYQDGYPALINTPQNTDIVIEALIDVAGEDNVDIDFDPIMGSEDFAFFLEKLPGCYFLLGNGEDSSPIHTPTYNFNDEASKYGIAAFVRIIELAMSSKHP
ncbi:amidohydrolase [Hellea balneolensis]|uniref:amidohydrolase n=1 Tax=Hellea balneolensis TaxID=287478 RepID=UPI0004071484|nr:amidohydrolase [Hellea balneolensis]